MRGELDWIVMKALEKDRNRRYETVSAFAADVQRHLNDEPVLACPPSVLYRLRKLAQRRKRSVGVAMLLLVMLLSLGVSSFLRWERDSARAAQGHAETAERDARELLKRAQKAEREVSIRAHLSRAAALRQRGDVGQRFGSLAELTAALKLDPSPELRGDSHRSDGRPGSPRLGGGPRVGRLAHGHLRLGLRRLDAALCPPRQAGRRGSLPVDG